MTNREDLSFCRVRFHCHCNQTQIGDQVCLLGSTASLGNWSFSHRLPLTTSPELFPLWRTECPVLLPVHSEVRYKFLICREDAPLCLVCRYSRSGTRVVLGPRKDAVLGRPCEPLSHPSFFPPSSTVLVSTRNENVFTECRDTDSDSVSFSSECDSEDEGVEGNGGTCPIGSGRNCVKKAGGREGGFGRVGRPCQGANGSCGDWRGDTCLQKQETRLSVRTKAVINSQMCCGAVMKGEWEASKRWENIRGNQGDRVLRVSTQDIEVFDTFGAEPTVPSAAAHPSTPLPSNARGQSGAPPSEPSSPVGFPKGCWYISPERLLFACDSADALERQNSQSWRVAGVEQMRSVQGSLVRRGRPPCLSHREHSSLSPSVAAAQNVQGTSLRRHNVPPLKLPVEISSVDSPVSSATPHYDPSAPSFPPHSYFSRLKRVDTLDVPVGHAPRRNGRRASAVFEFSEKNSASVSGGGAPHSARLPSLHARVTCQETPRKVPLSPLATDSFRSALQSMAAYYPAHGLGDLAPTALGSSPRRGCAGGQSETASWARSGMSPRHDVTHARCLQNGERRGDRPLSLLGVDATNGEREIKRETGEKETERGRLEGRVGDPLHAESKPQTTRPFSDAQLGSEEGEAMKKRRSSIACVTSIQERNENAQSLFGRENGGETTTEPEKRDIERNDNECVSKVDGSQDSSTILLRLLREGSLSLPSVLSLALASLPRPPSVSASLFSPQVSSLLDCPDSAHASSILFAMRHLLALNENSKCPRVAAANSSCLLPPTVSALPREVGVSTEPAEGGNGCFGKIGDENAKEKVTDACGKNDVAEDISMFLSKTPSLQDAALFASEAAFARLEKRLFETVQAAVCTPRVSEFNSPVTAERERKEDVEKRVEDSVTDASRNGKGEEEPERLSMCISDSQQDSERRKEGKVDDKGEERGTIWIRFRGHRGTVGSATDRSRLSFVRRKGMHAKPHRGFTEAFSPAVLRGDERRDEKENENDGDDEREDESRETSCHSTHASLSSFSSSPNFGAGLPSHRRESGDDPVGIRCSSVLSLSLASQEAEWRRKDSNQKKKGIEEGMVEAHEEKEMKEKQEKGQEKYLHEQLSCLNNQVTCLSSALYEIRREQAFSRQLLASLCGCLERSLETKEKITSVSSTVRAPLGSMPRRKVRPGTCGSPSCQLGVSGVASEMNSEGELLIRDRTTDIPGGTICSHLKRVHTQEEETKEERVGEEKEVQEGERGDSGLSDVSSVPVYPLDGLSSQCESEEGLEDLAQGDD